ncbi:MAG: DUF3450 domain-containing protein [Gammaproteobacteria bacterium]|nr:DUF3450 domain-containing protein [Gammaproteobacteria bacterium]
MISVRTLVTLLISIGMSIVSVYIYSQIDPRLEIITLKNEEIMRLDNKIASLVEKNSTLDVQVNSISTVVKSNEKDSGKINDEYKVCLRQTNRLKKKVRNLTSEVSVLQNKNKIMKDYVQVNNDVTSLKEQIENLNQQKQQLTDQLGPNLNQNLITE